jgi:transposase
MEDRGCKLGLAGRLELGRLVAQGASLRAAAVALGVAPATAHRWWHRWRAASEEERDSRVCLATRRPVPHSCPWALSEEQEQSILSAREKTNWGPMRLTCLSGSHRSTIWKVLQRHGRSRRRRSSPRETTRRYECSEAGALLLSMLPSPEVLGSGALGNWRAARAAQDPHPARPRPVILHPLLQPQTTTLSRKPSNTHQPRSARA